MRDIACRWETNLLAIPIFHVNPNLRAAHMRLPRFEATLPRDHGYHTPRDHSSRHGLLLRGDRSARPAGFAWKTGWGRWRARSARRPDHMQLRSAQFRRTLGNANLYGAAPLQSIGGATFAR